MKFLSTVKNNIYLYKMANEYCKSFLWVTIFTNIVKGLINTFVNVLFIKLIYSCFEKEKSFTVLVLYALVLSVVFVLFWLLNSWYDNCFAPLAKNKLYEGAYKKLFIKAANINIEYYDNSEYYDEFIWSMKEADERIYNAIILLGNFISTIIYAISMVGLIFTIERFVSISILFCVTLSMLLNVWRVNTVFKRDKHLYPLTRQINYYDRVMYLSEYAKDMKTSSLESLIEEKFDFTMKEINRWTKFYAKKTAIINFLMRCSTSTLFDVVLVMFMAYKVMVTKTMQISDFAVLINMIWQIFFSLNNIVNNVSSFFENGVYSNKLKKFSELNANLDNIEKNKDIKIFEKLSLRNVTFAYDDKLVLNNINLDINAGEKLAIVGYNGAGKSTLIKILLQLYPLESGHIFWNDEDATKYDIKSYQDNFGVIFQDYQLFAVELMHNVAMGLNVDFSKAKDALKKSGFDESLDDMLLSRISKEFDENGLILSGGQEQRVAISRTFYKDCLIQIFDEPSSSLDPNVEEEINNAMITENKGKTIVFVSHRLSTVRLADRIVFLNNGVIEEEGDHESLMRLNGKYAEMFRIQAEKYNR